MDAESFHQVLHEAADEGAYDAEMMVPSRPMGSGPGMTSRAIKPAMRPMIEER